MKPMTQKGSISSAIEGVKKGDANAADVLFARYFQRLARAAMPTLSRVRGGLRDEYVAASSTLREYLTKAETGELPGIEDRGALLAYLMVVVRKKAKDRVREFQAGKRREDCVVESTALLRSSEANSETAMDWAESTDPLQDDVLLFREVMEQIKAILTPREYRVLEMDMEGFSNAEIAAELGVGQTMVKRIRVLAIIKLAGHFKVEQGAIREAVRKKNSKHFG